MGRRSLIEPPSAEAEISGARGGPAFGLGPRRVLLAGATAVVVAAAVLVTVLLSGGHSPPARARYGGLPSWLPKPAKQASTPIPQATLEHPWLAGVEGETVSVLLPAGGALVTVVGPSVPESVAENAQKDREDSDTARCTFSATLRSTAGVVPLSPRAFTILGERGETFRPRVTNAAGGGLPSQITTGHSVTLTLRAQLPEGQGAVRWAPTGPRVVAGWIFGLELD